MSTPSASRAARERAALSAAYAAKRLGISLATLTRLEASGWSFPVASDAVLLYNRRGAACSVWDFLPPPVAERDGRGRAAKQSSKK